MSSAVIPIVRVAILADSRLTEIALPADLPLREILPAVERLVVPAVADDAAVAGRSVAEPTTPVRLSLAPIGGAPFSLDASLGTVGVVDGDLLALQPIPVGPAAPGIVEDIADAAVIFSTSRLKPWGAAHIQRGAIAGIVGLIWAATGLGVVHRVVTGSPVGAFVVGAIALLAVVAGLAVRSPRAGAALVRRRFGADRRGVGPGGTGSLRHAAGDAGRGRRGRLVADQPDPAAPRKSRHHQLFHRDHGAGRRRAAGCRCERAVAAAVGDAGCGSARRGAAGHRRSPATVRAVGTIPAAGHSRARRPDPVGSVVARARGPAATGPDQRRTPDRIHRRRRAAQRDRVVGHRVAAGDVVRLGLVRGRRVRCRGCAAGEGVGLGGHAKRGCWPSRILVAWRWWCSTPRRRST